MIDPLIENIGNVFSILPDGLAREAHTNTVMGIAAGGMATTIEVTWAEFDGNGLFLRGGGTDMSGLTRLVSSIDDDPIVAALTEAVRCGATPGAILPGADRDMLFWFVPVAARAGSRQSATIIKGLAISLAIFEQLGLIPNAEARLTPSEKRVLFQVVVGTPLRVAANADKVSVETRRSQIKSLCAKLNCGGKHELTRYALGQMMHLIALCEVDTLESGPVQQFAAKYLSDNTRLILQRLPNGRLLRCFEIGPRMGTPVLVMHGMLFPALIIGVEPFLAISGIRLIVPLRQGYLDARPLGNLLHDEDLMVQSLDDIAIFARQALGGRMAVLGHSYGAPIAIGFARKYPDIASSVILLSINAGTLHQEQHGFGYRFYSSLRRLLNQPGLFRLLSWQFRKAYADILTVRPILRQLYGGCDDDLAALEGENGAAAFYPWFAECYQTSIAGIAEDFRFILGDWRSALDNLAIPIAVIHGRRDALISADHVAAFADSVGIDRITWIDGGHLICATRPAEIWSAIAARVTPITDETTSPALQ